MKISHSVKILIGIATAWILVYPFIFIGAIVLMPLVFMTIENSTMNGLPIDSLGILIFPLHCLTIIVQLGLMVFYLIDVIKNKVASETLRVILGVGLFFMPFIAMPVYYYLYIWRDTPPNWAIEQPQQPAPYPTDLSMSSPTIEELKEQEKNHLDDMV